MRDQILITETDYAEAVQLADETYRGFSKRPGHYNNTPNSHLRGKIGEIAFLRWLEGLGVAVDAAFRDIARTRKADLIAEGQRSSVRLDVKTWDTRYWTEMGRCVAVGQLPKLQNKADGVIWCVSPAVLEPGVTVEVVGWNTLDEVANAPRLLTGPVGRRQVENFQVGLDAVRPLDDLLTMIQG